MEIWIGRDGERHGPYKEDDVRQWLRSGQVSPKDLAWYEGLADWQPLSVLFPDEILRNAPPPANPYSAPAAPLIPLPQTNAAALEDYAGFWKRVAAYILDAIVLYFPHLLIQYALLNKDRMATLTQSTANLANDPNAMMAFQYQFWAMLWPALLLTIVFDWLYFAICESSGWQATLGKLALGIRVTDLQGNRISFLRALGRFPAKILSSMILCVGFLMVAWTERKQGLHDLICGTLVLNGRASEFKSTPTSSSNNSFSA